MDKKLLIVGNWKMHLSVHQSSVLVQRLSERIATHRSIEVVIAPSMLSLQPLSVEIDRRRFRLAAQDAFYKDEGPCTGEVSFAMLGDLVHYAIVGHSWRRLNAGDTLDVVRDKVQAAIRNDIAPIICIGETKQERDAGEAKQVIHDQLTTALMNLTSKDIENVVLTYEPVWAIGTGVAATADDAEDMCRFIREVLDERFGDSSGIIIQYGGSANEKNAAELLAKPHVGGLLIGGASLKAESFAAMIEAAASVQGSSSQL